MKTIILCGGKTLGHVVPGISVIHELHKKYPMLRIVYITCDNQKELKIIKEAPIDKVIYFNLTFKNKLDKIIKILGQKGLFKTELIENIYKYNNIRASEINLTLYPHL